MPIFHPVSSPILSSPAKSPLHGASWSPLHRLPWRLRNPADRPPAPGRRQAQGGGALHGRCQVGAMVEAKMDCLEHRPRFVEEIQDVSVMSYSNKCGIVASVAGGLRFLLGPIAQNWRSLTCCEPIPQAAHSLQPRLAVAKKKVWNWSSSQIGSKLDIHETSWNYGKHQHNTLCGDAYRLILGPFGFLTQPYFFKLTAPSLWVAPLSTAFVFQVRGL